MSYSVTVAIPLHASLQWVDSISKNIGLLPDLVTEIILSDQTCIDNAAEILRARFDCDPRVTVLVEHNGFSWIEHCQFLIEVASSDLFMIMPHDDIFSPNWIPLLSAVLDSRPDVLLAYGHMQTVEQDGVTPCQYWTPPKHPKGIIGPWKALEMILDNSLHVPWRGLFRRQDVLLEGIRLLPQTAYPGNRYWGVDQLWVLSVALRGRLFHEPEAVTYKRVHPFSASSKESPILPGSQYRPASIVLSRFGPNGLKGIMMKIMLRWHWLRVVSQYLARTNRLRPRDIKARVRNRLPWGGY